MRIFFLILLSTISVLQADWNRAFDEKTQSLMEHFSAFRTQEYRAEYESFLESRQKLLGIPSFWDRIGKADEEDKFMMFCYEGLVLKKRARNKVLELFAFELSHLMGAPGYIVPSFPIDVQGRKVMVQKKEEFTIATKEEPIPLALLQKIAVEDYWKAHLMAYVLGMGDLVARNIGVSEEGRIRFFDIESSFKYRVPRVTSKSFSTGFVAESFEWPQYRQKLSSKEAKSLQKFIKGLAQFDQKLDVYLRYRFWDLYRAGMRQRLRKVLSFSVKEGVSFCGFYTSYLFPRMGRGLDELCQIVSESLEKEVDHGSAILYVSMRHRKYGFTAPHNRLIKEWIDQYIK